MTPRCCVGSPSLRSSHAPGRGSVDPDAAETEQHKWKTHAHTLTEGTRKHSVGALFLALWKKIHDGPASLRGQKLMTMGMLTGEKKRLQRIKSPFTDILYSTVHSLCITKFQEQRWALKQPSKAAASACDPRWALQHPSLTTWRLL